MKKKFLIIMLLAVFLLCSHMSVYAATSFTDLTEDHWAYDYIEALSQGGIINGYPDGTFQPEGTTTRAEFFKMMAITEADDEAVNSFSGKVFNWYDPYVEYIFGMKMAMIGTDSSGMDNPITRKEATMIIANYAVYNGFLESFDYETYKSFDVFEDTKSFGEYNKYLLNYACACGIITGYEDGTFRPDQTMTRAEVATILCRFCYIWTEGWEQ